MSAKDAVKRVTTDLEAKNAEAKDKLYRLSYGDGLQLEVRPSGGKFWIQEQHLRGVRR